MSQYKSRRRGGAPADHMLVTAANICGDDLENYPVLADPFSKGKFWEVDGLHCDLMRAKVNKASI